MLRTSTRQLIKQYTTMAATSKDIYIAVTPTGTSLSSPAVGTLLPAELSQVQSSWSSARTQGKQGESRTFYLGGSNGKVVVAVSTGGKGEQLKGEKDENAIKELARKNVRRSGT